MVRLSGWAADMANARPVERVLVFRGDQLLAAARPGRNRPDLAKVLGNEFEDSGFLITLPLRSFRRGAGPQLRVLALAKDGVVGELEYNPVAMAVAKELLIE